MRARVRRCSFCHKDENAVGHLIAKPSDYKPPALICHECVRFAAASLQPAVRNSKEPPADLPPHSELDRLFVLIRQWLDLEARGQDPAATLRDMRTLAREMMARSP